MVNTRYNFFGEAPSSRRLPVDRAHFALNQNANNIQDIMKLLQEFSEPPQGSERT